MTAFNLSLYFIFLQISQSKLGCMEVMCSINQCMVEKNVFTELKKGAVMSLYSWKPANFTEFWGKTLDEGINGKLGADKPEWVKASKVR